MTLDHLRHSTPVLKPALALALLLVMASVLLASACGSTDPTAAPTPTDPVDPDPTTTPTPTDPVDPDPTTGLLVPTPTLQFISSTYPDHGTTSLEERIFRADVIAHVRPVSVLGKWKTIPSDEGVAPTYLPFLEIGFKPIEYLKGSGDTRIIVEEPGRGTYLTKEMAQENADQMLRNRAWNYDEAVVFLEEGLGASGPEDSRYRFILSKAGFRGKYALDSDNKAWLPRGDFSRGDPVFLTDSEPSGERGVPPVISLKDLRSSIEAVDTLVKEGEGIDGYEECLAQRFTDQRYLRALEERIGRPFTPPGYQVQIASGLPAGSEFYTKYWVGGSGAEGYDKHWITGPDEDLFVIEIYDPDGDPGAYQISHTTTRPLPGGAYTFDDYIQLYIEIPCDYKQRHSVPWVVSVESPEGTLHEAFFDPVEVDGMIRASTDDGVIEPGTFAVRDVETTIASLTWEAASRSVTMELDPYVSLEGHAIDFIALDGSVSLSLDFDEASVKRVNRVSGALTWRVSNRPWQAGDKLMIRIRE